MHRISSIELAIQNETTEMAYYLNQANRSSNPMAKALFETLASEEKEHMTTIRRLHDKLVAQGSWPEDVPIDVAGTNVKTVLDGFWRDSQAAANHDADDMEALKKSISFEEKGADFYAELAKTCDNPQEKTFFEFLAGIEREHMLSLQDSFYYLEDPEGWLESKGRAGLDGA